MIKGAADNMSPPSCAHRFAQRGKRNIWLFRFANNDPAVTFQPRMCSKPRFVSFRLGYPDVNDGRVPILREEDLSSKRLGQTGGAGHKAASHAHLIGKLRCSGRSTTFFTWRFRKAREQCLKTQKRNYRESYSHNRHDKKSANVSSSLSRRFREESTGVIHSQRCR